MDRSGGLEINKRRLSLLFFVSAASVLLSSGALYNGYPLLYADSIEYVEGFSVILPQSAVTFRPLVYTLLINFVLNASGSLWPVVFLQNALLALCLWILFEKAGPRLEALRLRLFLTFVFAIPLGATWVQSGIMADAFTPSAVLGFCILLCCRPLLRSEYALLTSILLFSCLTHYSHTLLVSLMAGVILAWRAVRSSVPGRVYLKHLLFPFFALYLLAAVVQIGSHPRAHVGTPIPSYQIFILGRLADTGVLSRLLKEHCRDTPYIFCPFRRSFTDPGHLIWRGPVRKTLGFRNHPEYLRMIKDGIFYYPGQFISGNLATSWKLLRSFTVGAWIRPMDTTVMPAAISADRDAYLGARQQQDRLSFGWAARLLYAAVTLSALLSAVMLLSRRRFNVLGQTRKLVLSVVLAIVLNALICGSLSAVRDRYQVRLAWLLPAVILTGGAAGHAARRRH